MNPWPPRYRCDAPPTELWSLIGSRSRASSIYTRYMKRMSWCVYDKDHMSALRLKNTRERDPHSYVVTKQLQIKPRKNPETPTAFESMTSTIPVRCSTNWAMKPRRKQVKSELNLYPLYEENDIMCIWYKQLGFLCNCFSCFGTARITFTFTCIV